MQKFHQVGGIGAFFIEVTAVFPFDIRACAAGNAIDGKRALDVPGEVFSLEFDFDALEVVVVDPFFECFGQAIVDTFFEFVWGYGIEPADRVKQPDPVMRFAGEESFRIEALKIFAKIAREVVAHALGIVGVVTAHA